MRARNAHIFERDADDHYVEPHWCSKRLFDVERFGPPGSLIYEPATGWERIAHSAHAAHYAVISADIVDRRIELDLEPIPFAIRDFLSSTPLPFKPHALVTNPPFGLVREFCERAVEIATYKAALLVPQRRLNAARWLQRLPLETVWLLTPRPSMPSGAHILSGGYVGGGTADFCWLIFNNKQSSPKAPELKWLNRDTDEDRYEQAA